MTTQENTMMATTSTAVDTDRLNTLTHQARMHARKSVEHMIGLGSTLLEIKEMLPHGQFADYVEREIGLSIRTAQNAMNVARRFGGKSETVAHLPLRTVYQLAAPSVTEDFADFIALLSRHEAYQEFFATASLADIRRTWDALPEGVQWVTMQSLRASLGESHHEFVERMYPGIWHDFILFDERFKEPFATFMLNMKYDIPADLPDPIRRYCLDVLPEEKWTVEGSNKTAWTFATLPPRAQELVLRGCAEEALGWGRCFGISALWNILHDVEELPSTSPLDLLPLYDGQNKDGQACFSAIVDWICEGGEHLDINCGGGHMHHLDNALHAVQRMRWRTRDE